MNYEELELARYDALQHWLDQQLADDDLLDQLMNDGD